MMLKDPSFFDTERFGGTRLYREASRRLMLLWNTPPGRLPKNLPTVFLKVASEIYIAGLHHSQARLRKGRTRLPAFVISVGNLAAGGTGKTPLVMWICGFLSAEGYRPAILSRGYGRKETSPAPVTSGRCDLFGDEPVLMAETLPSVPVWVGRERALTGKAALSRQEPVDMLVLDDGFQHLALDRDLDLVLLDCRSPFGNGFTLPLGPLREPVSHLRRADALVLTRAENEAMVRETLAALDGIFPAERVFSCRHDLTGFRPGIGGPLIPLSALGGRRVAAFAGIAGPEKFFSALSGRGIDIRAAHAFPDHHGYTGLDLARIVESASKSGAEFIVTTAKDAVRVPPLFKGAVMAAEMRIDFGPDEERFRAFLQERISKP